MICRNAIKQNEIFLPSTQKIFTISQKQWLVSGSGVVDHKILPNMGLKQAVGFLPRKTEVGICSRGESRRAG